MCDACCVLHVQVLLQDHSHSVLLPFSAVGSHPHINTAAEIIVGASSVYVMHHASLDATEDLHAYVRRKRRLSEQEAARLFAQALKAVAHCHRHGVVVRDVKLRRFLFADADRYVVVLSQHLRHKFYTNCKTETVSVLETCSCFVENVEYNLIFKTIPLLAPCGLRGCKNGPAPFPGRMSYKATKPGLVSVLYLSMFFIVLVFIRAPFYVLLVFIICVLSFGCSS